MTESACFHSMGRRFGKVSSPRRIESRVAESARAMESRRAIESARAMESRRAMESGTGRTGTWASTAVPNGASCQTAQLTRSAKCQRARNAKRREMPKSANCQTARNAKRREMPKSANCRTTTRALCALRPSCPALSGISRPLCPAQSGIPRPLCPALSGIRRPSCPALSGISRPLCPAQSGISRSWCSAQFAFPSITPSPRPRQVPFASSAGTPPTTGLHSARTVHTAAQP